MTSVLRRVDQIPPRIRYLLTVAGATGSTGTLISNVSAFTVPQGTFGPIDQIQNNITLSVSATPIFPTVGSLYRDLGRSLYVYDVLGAGGLQQAIFRQVMPVSGPTSEGVPTSIFAGPSTYVKTWTATGQGVIVVRTG